MEKKNDETEEYYHHDACLPDAVAIRVGSSGGGAEARLSADPDRRADEASSQGHRCQGCQGGAAFVQAVTDAHSGHRGGGAERCRHRRGSTVAGYR